MFLAFALIISGTSAAATTNTTHFNQTIQNNASSNHNITNKTVGHDPIITGTVQIDDYSTKTVANATVTVSSGGKILDTTTTDKNGNYYLNFYSTATSFSVTASYPGCTSVTQTVTVAKGPNYPTDPNYYGTSNFILTVQQAQLTGTGNGDYSLYINYSPDSNSIYFAGVIQVSANGNSYNGYCIDLYTPISINDHLWINGPLPGTTGTLPTQVDWSAVTYIINHYSASSNDEAAAIQCAIWYFSTAEYGAYPGTNTTYPGRYQYMTYSQDAMIGSNSTVRNLALNIISQTKDMLYPNSIVLSPGITNVPTNQAETVTATVHDQNGNPLSGITVNFSTTAGTLSSSSATTNSNGQATVTLTPPTGSNNCITVTGSVSGNYGNLLYDNPATPLQNLVAMNILPNIVSATSILNYATTANVALTQTATTPVNVNNQVTYTITATGSGPNTATGIMISDTAPSSLGGTVTITPSSGTTYYNGIWTIPSLANEATATLTITGTATSSMAGQYTTNTATRTFQNEYDADSNVTSATVYVKKADVVLTQTANSPVNVGDTVTYTVTAKNNGPDTATNIKISDTAPTGFTVTPSTGTTYSGGVWTINSLASGSTATLTVTGTATIPMSGTNTPNTATQTSQTEYTDQYTTTTTNVYTKKAALTITNTANPTTANVGDTASFTLNVNNTGPDTASNINITDAIPTGFTLTSSSASQEAITPTEFGT